KTLVGQVVTRILPLPAPPRIAGSSGGIGLRWSPSIVPADRGSARFVGPSGGIGLLILFEDGSSFQVMPRSEPDETDREAPLADWEMFTPYHTYLRCGPGYSWSYRRSDLPAAPAHSSA